MFAFLNKYKGIVITNQDIKRKILDYFFEKKEFIPFTFKSTNEVICDILGEYDTNAFLSLGKKYSPEICEILLKNSLLVNDNNSESLKINNLVRIKKSYIKANKNLSKYNEVLLINYYYNDDLFNKALNKLKESGCKIKEEYIKNDCRKDIIINEFNSQKDEVFACVKKICKLVYNGVSFKDIYVYYSDSEYMNILKEAACLYQLPINFNKKNRLSEYSIVIELLKDLELNLYLDFDKYEIEDKYLKGELGKYITKILNDFCDENLKIEEIIDLTKYKFNNTYVDSNNIKGNEINNNSINIISDLNCVFSENEHLFVLGFNQNLVPSIYKNDDYLSDLEKKELLICTSFEKNKYEKAKIINLISCTKNIYLSYSNASTSRSLIPSSIILDMKKRFKVDVKKDVEFNNISYSNRASNLEFNKSYDDFIKYNIVSDDLKMFRKEFKYRKFSSENKGIKKGKIADFINKGMVLSYTSITEYYKCPYMFYLKRILKVNKDSGNDRSLLIGNLFHDCLYKAFLNGIDEENLDNEFSELMKAYYEDNNIEILNELSYFNDIYLYYLVNVYRFIKKTMTITKFKISSLEEEYSVREKHNFLIVGKIDKVLESEINGEKYAIVIDYKTGSSGLDLNKVIYGIDMQILFYYYLLNSKHKYKFAGGYLSHILPVSVINFEKNKTLEDQLNSLYRLDGYTNSDIKVMKAIDNNCFEKSYLKSIAFKSGTNDLTENGLKKVINDIEYEKLLQVVYKKIEEAIDNIYDGFFPIRPLELSTLSCDMCSYRDICYVTKDKINKVKPYKDLNFIREGE